MRTLDEIVSAARLGEPLTGREARYAVVAFDVLLARLELERDVPRLQEWMTAATMAPGSMPGPLMTLKTFKRESGIERCETATVARTVTREVPCAM